MDIISAYREVGSYRGAAAISGTTAKTVKRVIARHESGGAPPPRAARGRNYDAVCDLVVERVEKTKGRITAKRLLPAARVAGYEGSPRNFRRLVAARKALWRNDNHRGRRPAVWSPGEHLVIDWGVLGGLHVFCTVLAWSRVRFVRFADNERAETTLGLPLAAAGLLNPLIAGAAMTLSSVFVVSNSLRLRRFQAMSVIPHRSSSHATTDNQPAVTT